jgi:hypothetical protein
MTNPGVQDMQTSNKARAVLWILSGVLAGGSVALADAKADAVLASARKASGGAAWDALTSLGVEAEADSNAMGKFNYRIKVAIATSPREVAHIQAGNMTAAWGWDGEHGWDMDPSGAVQTMQKPSDIAERRTAVYGDAYGYFFLDRIKAERSYVGRRQYEGKSFDVVRITPEGGAAIELWVNAKTHWVERQVGTSGDPVQTQTFADFRQVGGVTVPFSIRSFDKATGKQLDATMVKTVKANIDVSDSEFAAPAAKAAAARS